MVSKIDAALVTLGLLALAIGAALATTPAAASGRSYDASASPSLDYCEAVDDSQHSFTPLCGGEDSDGDEDDDNEAAR